jgi:hypoxanthine phosphoribosyltransferase
MKLANDIEVLISADDIAICIDALVDKLMNRIDDDTVVVALMDGALIFAADLLRGLYSRGVNPIFENMTLSSYGDDIQSAGVVSVQKGLSRDVSGCKVIIVDDVFETGLTLKKAADMVKKAGASEVLTCVFATKSGYSEDNTAPDFSGWDAPDAFLVGYGMDFKGQYRGLPYIGDLLGSAEA